MKVFVYALRKFQGDVAFLGNLVRENTGGWWVVEERLRVEETMGVSKGNKCDEWGGILGHSQYLWAECEGMHSFCERCVERDLGNFKVYHSNYFWRALCHGKHALVHVSADTKEEFLETLLHRPKTVVPESYYDEDDIQGEQLQQNTITDFWDFCARAIKR